MIDELEEFDDIGTDDGLRLSNSEIVSIQISNHTTTRYI